MLIKPRDWWNISAYRGTCLIRTKRLVEYQYIQRYLSYKDKEIGGISVHTEVTCLIRTLLPMNTSLIRPYFRCTEIQKILLNCPPHERTSLLFGQISDALSPSWEATSLITPLFHFRRERPYNEGITKFTNWTICIYHKLKCLIFIKDCWWTISPRDSHQPNSKVFDANMKFTIIKSKKFILKVRNSHPIFVSTWRIFTINML